MCVLWLETDVNYLRQEYSKQLLPRFIVCSKPCESLVVIFVTIYINMYDASKKHTTAQQTLKSHVFQPF